MRLSLKRLLRCSRSLQPFPASQTSWTCRPHNGTVGFGSAAPRSIHTPPELDATFARVYGDKAKNARLATPASLADAVREEDMYITRASDELKTTSTVRTDEEFPDTLLRPPLAERKNEDAWMLVLDRFLPKDLRVSGRKDRHTTLFAQRAAPQILQILKSAQSRSNAGVDLLASMGSRHGRWKAVIWVADKLLKRVAADVAIRAPSQMPSNIAWPQRSLFELCKEPIEVENLIYHNKQPTSHWHLERLDPRYSDTFSEEKDSTLSQLWSSLGNLIIDSEHMPETSAQEAMSVVYRIIGQIHNSDLIPDNVYSYAPTSHTSSTHRPAILHLLSSRMLTTLSDAVWRSYQDEVIAQATKMGAELKDIGNDPPGGRFRLKVRPLGPEVWLEFVLWCCVDGGFAAAGTRIIEHLRRQTSNPWFAVNWTSAGGAAIDWNRVKLRHGGTVGQIEGYSSERPFAEMDPRTISTDVVLCLVESVIDSVSVGRSKKFVGLSTRRAVDWIKTAISFLEPHSLPLEYFDYLGIRMTETGGFDLDRQPQSFLAWTNALAYLRSLESTNAKPALKQDLQYETILAQSELHSGLLHESLEGLVAFGDVRNAIDVFSTIQQSVDNSKLLSIGAFLQGTSIGNESEFLNSTTSPDLDYVRSHGQLPPYKMAGFLNLITDSKLVRLGQWLLYSDDVDGPTIPTSAYRLSSMASSLVRFAALSNDAELANTVSDARHQSDLKPSVAFQRHLVNAHLSFLEFGRAESVLQRLTSAQAGGYAPSNMAQLVAVILNLESKTIGLERATALQSISSANNLAEGILLGFYDGIKGHFWLEQRSIFRKQIGSIFRVIKNLSDTNLGLMADKWGGLYDAGNNIGLPTPTFNIILAAVVETKGAREGRKLWDLFCEDPRAKYSSASALSPNEYFVPHKEQIGEDEWEVIHQIRPKSERPKALGRNLPVVNVNEPEKSIEAASPDQGVWEAASASASAPQAEGGIGFSAPNGSSGDELTSSAGLFDNSAAMTKTPVFNPLVAPDLRTLRLIVRGALTEQRTLRARDLDTSEQQTILRWATQFYKAFGSSKQLIEQEIQQSYVDDELTPAEAMALYNAERIKLGLRDLSAVDITRHFEQGAEETRVPWRFVRGDKLSHCVDDESVHIE